MEEPGKKRTEEKKNSRKKSLAAGAAGTTGGRTACCRHPAGNLPAVSLLLVLFGFSEQFLFTVNINNVFFPKNQNLHLSFQGQE